LIGIFTFIKKSGLEKSELIRGGMQNHDWRLDENYNACTYIFEAGYEIKVG
jgi:hypothetical protein